MGNALSIAGSTSAAAPRRTVEEMRAWCWNHNVAARDGGWANWLYVSTDKETGANTVKVRTGSDASDVVKVINGWKPDFQTWPQERLDSEFRILRQIARMGMPVEQVAKFRAIA